MSTLYDAAYRSRPGLFGVTPDRTLVDFIEHEEPKGPALDLGCGDGRNSIFLARRGLQVHALDTSRPGIVRLSEFARRRNLPITAQVGDIRNLQPGMEPFGLIVADTVLCHLDWRDARRVAARIHDLLRSGGWLYASSFTKDDPQESEFAPITRSYFDPNAFRSLFSRLSVKQYHHRRVTDDEHGPIHEHVIVSVVARRED